MSMDEFLSALDPLVVIVVLAVSGATGALIMRYAQAWWRRRPR